MRKMILAGERCFESEDKRSIDLFYYLIEDYRDAAIDTPLYGIQITKRMKDLNGVIQEKETASAITYSEGLAKQIIYRLMDHMVTPMCLLEIVDDMVTQEIYRTA